MCLVDLDILLADNFQVMKRGAVRGQISGGHGSECYQNLQKQTSCSGEGELPAQYIIKNYRGTSKYCLNHINSIFLKDGKFYNLLEKMSPKRIIKCGCVKSNCESKYCECYRAGQTCGEMCGCTCCKNKKTRKLNPQVKRQDEYGCNCVKSNCLKKYCECYQNNRKCGHNCNCYDCKNCDHAEL